MIRHVWNGAAIVQMFWYDIAWGGTLAVKWDTIRRANLLDRWSHALCEDTMLCRELKSISQRIAFVPACMMINLEDCTLESFMPWVKRQLLTARLYHPKWFAVVGHGVTSAGLLLWGCKKSACCFGLCWPLRCCLWPVASNLWASSAVSTPPAWSPTSAGSCITVQGSSGQSGSVFAMACSTRLAKDT